jgi:flagellar basal-body rod protein FlgG
MVKGLYTASEGMKANLRKQEIQSNNLANVNTTGFKKGELFTRAYLDYVNNDLNQPFVNDEHTIDEVIVDYTPGAMVNTGNKLDVAIEGKAFFAVQNSSGEVNYTRNGAFTIDSEGHLSTLNGEKLIGETGRPIEIAGKNVMISDDANVVVDGQIANKIKTVEFKEPYNLIKNGSHLYAPSNQTEMLESATVKLRQGHLEGSNVNPVESMVKMIAGFRNYEADERAMQASDQTLNKAVNEVGRIR